jgi:hypothetical protein
MSVPYFSTLSQKGYDFQKKYLTENKIDVLILSTILSVTYLILSIEGDIIINVHRSSRKVPVIEMKLDFPRPIFEKYSNINFHENPFRKREVVHSDGPTDIYADRHNEANSRFSHFWERTQKREHLFEILVSNRYSFLGSATTLPDTNCA